MAKPPPACRVCRRELSTEVADIFCPTCRKLVDAKRSVQEQATTQGAEKRRARKKLKQLLAKSQTRDPFERLPVYLSFSDVELFEDFLKVYDPSHKLLPKLSETKQRFFDDIARRHEIEAREKSNAWWDQPENWVNSALRNERMAYAKKVKRAAQGIENIARANKKRRRKAELEVEALPSDDLRNQLVVAGLVHPESNAVEQLVDAVGADAEQSARTDPAVPGNEGQNLKVEEGDGGRNGTLA